MPEERRSVRRAQLSGIRVTYESASGEVRDAEVANLSREGLFIATPQPLAVGKRLSLELLVAGEAGPWAALGRVLWIRSTREGDERPAGRAVKIIDIEESVAVAIDRLIELRERTEPGLGGGGARVPAREKPLRERTMLGIGIALPGGQAVPRPEAAPVAAPRPEAAPVAAPRTEAAPEAPSPAAPAARSLPSREKTVLGVGLDAAGVDPREPSVAIDLVAKKPASVRPPPAADERVPPIVTTRSASETREAAEAADRRLREFEKAAGPADEGPPSEAPAPARRSSVGWWVLLVILAACVVCAYAFRDRLLPIWHGVTTEVLRRAR